MTVKTSKSYHPGNSRCALLQASLISSLASDSASLYRSAAQSAQSVPYATTQSKMVEYSNYKSATMQAYAHAFAGACLCSSHRRTWLLAVRIELVDNRSTIDDLSTCLIDAPQKIWHGIHASSADDVSSYASADSTVEAHWPARLELMHVPQHY